MQSIPQHIAIIMDGNGRWAKKRMLPNKAGHKAGANALNTLVKDAEKIGIKYLTVYAFSTENWRRSNEEVEYLMGLLHDYVDQYIKDSSKNNVKITFIGDETRLDEKLQQKIIKLKQLTKNKTGICLIIALNYGGKDELVRSIKKICKDVKEGKLNYEKIDEKTINNYLDTAQIPEPELLIRTSGELRLSNFLIWQSAYTELYFTDTLWPDFKISHLQEAISQYQKRQRRFGAH